jgi:hypothetical protein
MPDFSKLKPEGIAARNELLELLKAEKNKKGDFIVSKIKDKYFPTIFDSETLKQVRDLDRPLTLAAIMRGSVESPKEAEAVDSQKLKRFFVKLIEDVSNTYRDKCGDDGKIICQALKAKLKREYIISHSDLRKYLSIHRKSCQEKEKEDWFPVNLCKVSSRSPKYTQSSDCNSITDHQLKIMLALLDDLDYETQETTFYNTLNEKRAYISFSIVAPCYITQNWILNRLLRKAIDDITGQNLFDQNRMLHMFNLNPKTVMNYEDFLYKLSSRFRCEADTKVICHEICEMEGDMPIIFVISGSKKHHLFRKRIVDEFWSGIQKNLSSTSTETKIIMFWVDDYSPFSHTENTGRSILLERLDRIDATDIKKWVSRHQNGFQFSDVLTKKQYLKSDWYWTDPLDILDKICKQLGLSGIAEVYSKWEYRLFD